MFPTLDGSLSPGPCIPLHLSPSGAWGRSSPQDGVFFPSTHKLPSGRLVGAGWHSGELSFGVRWISFKSQLHSSHQWDPGWVFKTLYLPSLVSKIKTWLPTLSVAGRTEKDVCEVASSRSCPWASYKYRCMSFLTHPVEVRKSRWSSSPSRWVTVGVADTVSKASKENILLVPWLSSA